MDHFTISNPTCRTDLSIFIAHRDVDPHDHFRVDMGTETHVLSDPDERLVVGVDTLALWHAEGCTRVAFEDIEALEWHGDTIAQRDDDAATNILGEERRVADQAYNQMVASMDNAFRRLGSDELRALKDAHEQGDDLVFRRALRCSDCEQS